MTYHVEFTSAAARQIRKLPSVARERIFAAAADLATNPRPAGSRKLVGVATAWRIRVGEYRVIYDIFDKTLTVTVVRAAHRRESYNR